MTAVLVNAVAGTSKIVNTGSAKCGQYDASITISGTHVGDKVNVFVSNSAKQNDFAPYSTPALIVNGATRVLLFEGPWYRVKLVADGANAGTVSAYLEMNV